MAEEIIADEPGGQVDDAADAGTSDTSDSFFDPKELAEELLPAYKNMQASYTKKMQGLSGDRNKVEAYDAFYSNPVENIRNVAKQYGIDLGGKPEPAGPDITAEDYQPKSWQEVFDKGKEMALQEFRTEMEPYMRGMQQSRKESIEHTLNEIDPTWQQYEDSMKENMGRHPSLSQDPALLYRISVPPEVLESQATQRALKRLEAKGQAAQISASSTTTKHSVSALPDKAVSFEDAVSAAKKKLAEEGIAPGK